MHKNLVELKENLLVGRQIQQKNNSAGARCCDHGRCDLTETMPQKSFGRNGYCGYTDQRHDQGPCRKPFLGSSRPFYLEYARAGNYLLNFHRIRYIFLHELPQTQGIMTEQWQGHQRQCRFQRSIDFIWYQTLTFVLLMKMNVVDS